MATALRTVLSQGTTDTSNNRTYVTVNVYADSTSGSFNNNSQPGSVTLDGTTYNFSHGYSANVTTLLASFAKWCYHDKNGYKNVSTNASYVTGTGSGTIYASASKVLTQINTYPNNITSFLANPDPVKDNESCVLSWSGATVPNYAIDYYYLYVRRYKNGAWSSYIQIGGNITGTSYTHNIKATYTDLKAGEIIQYKVYTHSTSGRTSTGYEVANTVEVISSSTMSIRIDGVYKKGIAYTKINDTWKKGTKCFVKVNGIWKANK